MGLETKAVTPNHMTVKHCQNENVSMCPQKGKWIILLYSRSNMKKK